MTYNVPLEDLISNIGGCGKFQWILVILVHISKTIATWTMIHMTFNGQEPAFSCIDNKQSARNGTVHSVKFNVSRDGCPSSNVSGCKRFLFKEDMHTIVSEWDLVCDRKWTVATITTIQMGGVLIGCFIAGHFGDWIGRKPTYFMSILILLIFNVVAYFSVSWKMYAAIRFILGMGNGFFTTVHINQMCEFTTSIWRPRIMAVPSWSIGGGLFALLAWIFKDWKILHLASAAVGLPFLLSWWFVPESFRWLVTRGRFKDAEKVIDKIASLNGHVSPDVTKVIEQASLERKGKTKHYSVIDLFKTRESIIKTLALLFIWAAESYAYYGLTFGIQNMAGDFYVNMFVLYAVEVPAEISGMYLMNRFGRKRTCIVSMFLTGLCGVANGVLQYVDISPKDVLINVFALASRLGVAISWLSIAVLTTEIYPTVVRASAFGVHNTSARIGGMIAPQIVFLNEKVPGLMFFLGGAVMFANSFLCFLFTETKGRTLEDTLDNYRENVQLGLHKDAKNPDIMEVSTS